MRTPEARSFSCQVTRRGISSLQGPHHAAQRVIHTHLPTPTGRPAGGGVASVAVAVLRTLPFGAGRGDCPAQSCRGAAGRALDGALGAGAVAVVGALAVSRAATTLARPVSDG